MEKKKLKKLKINKMSEFSVIGDQEQMEMKGGTGPTWLFQLLTDLAISYVVSGSSDSGTDSSNNYGSDNDDNNVIITVGSDNNITINGQQYSVPDSIYINTVDSIGPNGVYYGAQGVTIYP